jgi:Ca2+/Na+ antiporter
VADGSTGEAHDEHRFGSNIYIAFVPWLLFSVITTHAEVRAAAVIALVASILISLPSLRDGHPKALEIGAIVAFVAFTIVALLADAETRDWLARYARAIAAGLLALIAFVSLLRTPFTEQYAREAVPEELWSSPRFKSINRQLTTMWGFVFLLMVPSHVAAGAIDTHRAATIFNWVIPIGLVVFAVKRQGKISGQDENASGGQDPDVQAHGVP